METLNHLLHSVIIGVVSYLLMVYLLKQSNEKALNRSIILAAISSIYMVLFGHAFPPGKINPNL